MSSTTTATSVIELMNSVASATPIMATEAVFTESTQVMETSKPSSSQDSFTTINFHAIDASNTRMDRMTSVTKME